MSGINIRVLVKSINIRVLVKRINICVLVTMRNDALMRQCRQRYILHHNVTTEW